MARREFSGALINVEMWKRSPRSLVVARACIRSIDLLIFALTDEIYLTALLVAPLLARAGSTWPPPRTASPRLWLCALLDTSILRRLLVHRLRRRSGCHGLCGLLRLGGGMLGLGRLCRRVGLLLLLKVRLVGLAYSSCASPLSSSNSPSAASPGGSLAAGVASSTSPSAAGSNAGAAALSRLRLGGGAASGAASSSGGGACCSSSSGLGSFSARLALGGRGCVAARSPSSRSAQLVPLGSEAADLP